MASVRVHLGPLAALWLSFQLVGLIAAPIGLKLATTVEQLCTCPGGDHDTCPMHHGQPAQSAAQQAGRCLIQSTQKAPDAALLPLATGLGMLPAVSVTASETISYELPAAPVHLESHRELPDSPPPRA